MGSNSENQIGYTLQSLKYIRYTWLWDQQLLKIDINGEHEVYRKITEERKELE